MFPLTKWTRINTAAEQLKHVLSEVIELLFEIAKGDRKRALEEFTDLKHSIETLEHVLDREYGFTPEEKTKAQQEVVLKNLARDYYLPCEFCGEDVAYHEVEGKVACHKCLMEKVK